MQISEWKKRYGCEESTVAMFKNGPAFMILRVSKKGKQYEVAVHSAAINRNFSHSCAEDAVEIVPGKEIASKGDFRSKEDAGSAAIEMAITLSGKSVRVIEFEGDGF